MLLDHGGTGGWKNAKAVPTQIAADFTASRDAVCVSALVAKQPPWIAAAE